jgi:hypothetical protein
MIKIKGTLNNKGEVVFQRGKPLPLKTLYQQQLLQMPVESVNQKEDIKEVIEFIKNDKIGLRLKPDWDYPDSERNQSFELWLNE